MPAISLLSALFCLTLLGGCASSTVQPWQKQDLARPEMQLDGGSTETSFEDHFYFSKEGSTGGRGFSGGGCGCN